MVKPKKEDIPKEVLEEMEEARRASASSSYYSGLLGLERLCAQSADDEGLPTEQGEYWAVDEDGNSKGPVGLIELVKLLGYEDNEHVYFTAWHLTYIDAIRRLRDAGEVDAAIEAAIALGSCLTDQERFSDIIWSLGKRRSEVRGNAPLAAWGTHEERRAKNEKLVALYEEAMTNGAKTREEAYESVAKRAGTSARTIRRAVTGH